MSLGQAVGWSDVVTGVSDVRTGRLLLINSLVDATGTGLFLAGSTLFLIHEIGLSGLQIGLGLAIAGLIGLATVLPIGVLVSHVGAKHVLIFLHAWRAVGFALFPAIHDFAGFVIVASFVAIPDRSAPATSLTYLFGVSPNVTERVIVAAGMRSMDNVGFSLGALVAFLALLVGTRTSYDAVFFGNALSFVAAAVLVGKMINVRGDRAGRRGAVADSASDALHALRDVRFRVALLANGVLSCHIPLLSVGLPLWLAQYTTAPQPLMGILFGLNTVITVLAQVAVSRRVSDRVSGSRSMALSGLTLAGCCLIFALASGRPTVMASAILIVGLVMLTGGELLQASGSWAVSFAYAQRGNAALSISAFALGNSARQVVGPLLIATCITGLGAYGLVVLAALFLVAGTVCHAVT